MKNERYLRIVMSLTAGKRQSSTSRIPVKILRTIDKIKDKINEDPDQSADRTQILVEALTHFIAEKYPELAEEVIEGEREKPENFQKELIAA